MYMYLADHVLNLWQNQMIFCDMCAVNAVLLIFSLLFYHTNIGSCVHATVSVR